jgi:hypothetical protein
MLQVRTIAVADQCGHVRSRTPGTLVPRKPRRLCNPGLTASPTGGSMAPSSSLTPGPLASRPHAEPFNAVGLCRGVPVRWLPRRDDVSDTTRE